MADGIRSTRAILKSTLDKNGGKTLTAESGCVALGLVAAGMPGLVLPDLKGKLLILNFWASWCQPCVEETPSLSQLAKDYAGRGVVVMAISVDSSEKAYRAFLEKYKPGFLTARDARIHRDYGTFVYPETYIIDSSGKVAQKIAEGADWSSPDVRRYIDSLL